MAGYLTRLDTLYIFVWNLKILESDEGLLTIKKHNFYLFVCAQYVVIL